MNSNHSAEQDKGDEESNSPPYHPQVPGKMATKEEEEELLRSPEAATISSNGGGVKRNKKKRKAVKVNKETRNDGTKGNKLNTTITIYQPYLNSPCSLTQGRAWIGRRMATRQ